MVEIKKIKKFIPDATDVLVFAGIGLIGTGTWQISPPISLIIVGTLFLLLALTPYIAELIKARK